MLPVTLAGSLGSERTCSAPQGASSSSALVASHAPAYAAPFAVSGGGAPRLPPEYHLPSCHRPGLRRADRNL